MIVREKMKKREKEKEKKEIHITQIFWNRIPNRNLKSSGTMNERRWA